MIENECTGDCHIHLTFNGPVHQVVIGGSPGTGKSKIGMTPEFGTGAPESFGPRKSLSRDGGIRATFEVEHPQADENFETTASGDICAAGLDNTADQMRAKVFGGRDPGNPPTLAEIDAAYPTAPSVPHDKIAMEWRINPLHGASFEPGKANFLVVWSVKDVYTADRKHQVVRFTSKLSNLNWCDLYSSPGGDSAVHSEHPDIYEIHPVDCGENSPAAGSGICGSGSNILVREPGSHEDYPVWRSIIVGKSADAWVLHGSRGPDGSWGAVLRKMKPGGDGLAAPLIWASTSDWSTGLGGVMVGAGVPELQIRKAG